jgi:hypothetical protein
MKRALLILLALVATVSTARAQDNLTTVLYNVSFPGGEFRDFIDETSFRGATIEFMKYPTRDARYTTGLSLGWQVFDQRGEETTQIENGAVTGTQRKYVNAFPMFLMGNYYLGNERGGRLLMGFGAGAVYTVQRLEIGVRGIEETNWHFGIAPQLGFQFPVGLEVEFVVSARYNVIFGAGEGIDGEKVDVGYFTAGVGLAHLSW